MSLLRRVERAQQAAAELANGTAPTVPAAPVPVMSPTPAAPPAAPPPVSPTAPRTPPTAGAGIKSRDELMHDIRMRLQGEVVNALDSLLDAAPEAGRPRVPETG